MTDATTSPWDAYVAQQEAAPTSGEGAEELRPGEWRSLWTWIELAEGEVLPASLENLGRGREIAQELGTRNCAVLFGHGVLAQAARLGEHGADRVYVIDAPPFAEFDLDRCRDALVQLVRARQPEVLLLPATIQGRNLGAQVSTALGVGIVPNCNGLTLEPEDRLIVGHQTSFDERLLSRVVCGPERPQVFTITPGSFRRPTKEAARAATVLREEAPPLRAARVRVGAPEAERPKRPAQYDAVVAAGFELSTKEGFAMARELAAELRAHFGGTRGAVALGHVQPSELITVSREPLRPRLYVACGVVGEYDHLRAVEKAELVVALTPDANAPVADAADLVAVGEPAEVLRRIVAHLRAAKTERVRLTG